MSKPQSPDKLKNEVRKLRHSLDNLLDSLAPEVKPGSAYENVCDGMFDDAPWLGEWDDKEK
jgi:hypothetical protein